MKQASKLVKFNCEGLKILLKDKKEQLCLKLLRIYFSMKNSQHITFAIQDVQIKIADKYEILLKHSTG